VLSPLVNEGGGIHVDGLGTVLLTETVQLDPGRNPGMSRADVEAEMARTIGATTCIWLPRGLTRDYDEFGTRGHVDIVATFASPGVVLLHWQGDTGHPDHEVSVELEGLLSSARDARGERLEVVRVPAPKTLEDDEGPVDWSYINHLVVNGGVIGCAFDDPNDLQAKEILEVAYPGREVVMVPAKDVFSGGGGIHCITQQEPAAGRSGW
jgi:agmatine deiminase